jgi:hypothetical protein
MEGTYYTGPKAERVLNRPQLFSSRLVALPHAQLAAAAESLKAVRYQHTVNISALNSLTRSLTHSLTHSFTSAPLPPAFLSQGIQFFQQSVYNQAAKRFMNFVALTRDDGNNLERLKVEAFQRLAEFYDVWDNLSEFVESG